MAALALTTQLTSPLLAAAQSVDTIVRWNKVMFDAIIVPGAIPPTVFNTRILAITSVAVFDAVNSFDETYEAYAADIRPAQGASRDAAASQAAHDVLWP